MFMTKNLPRLMENPEKQIRWAGEEIPESKSSCCGSHVLYIFECQMNLMFLLQFLEYHVKRIPPLGGSLHTYQQRANSITFKKTHRLISGCCFCKCNNGHLSRCCSKNRSFVRQIAFNCHVGLHLICKRFPYTLQIALFPRHLLLTMPRRVCLVECVLCQVLCTHTNTPKRG
jgi:hypothetical protein